METESRSGPKAASKWDYKCDMLAANPVDLGQAGRTSGCSIDRALCSGPLLRMHGHGVPSLLLRCHGRYSSITKRTPQLACHQARNRGESTTRTLRTARILTTLMMIAKIPADTTILQKASPRAVSLAVALFKSPRTATPTIIITTESGRKVESCPNRGQLRSKYPRRMGSSETIKKTTHHQSVSPSARPNRWLCPRSVAYC